MVRDSRVVVIGTRHTVVDIGLTNIGAPWKTKYKMLLRLPVPTCHSDNVIGSSTPSRTHAIHTRRSASKKLKSPTA